MGSSVIPGFSGAPTLTQASSDINTPGFTGLSSYSSDLQNALNRSLALASLPLQLLQNQQTQLSNESSALNSLDTQFSALQTAIASLNSASQNLVSSSISDGSVLTANIAVNAASGTYTVHVLDPGSFSSSLSSDGLTTVTDPTQQSLSTASSFTLTVDGATHTITPAAHTLTALAAAINADSSAGVQAAIINVGSPSAPDYRLSLQSTKLGNVSIQLNDGSSNLLTSLTTGTLAQYQVNGAPAIPISSDSRTVTIAPGVTVNLLSAGTSTVTVSQTASSIVNALSSFVNAYNSAVDELDKSHGQNAGALGGQSIVFDLGQSLRQLANYTGTGASFTSLTDLGLSFDKDGHLNFDATGLSNLSASQLSDLSSFLGGASSGGFLQFATNQLNAIEDPTSGILKSAITATTEQITHESQLISNEQDQISQLQTSLQTRMAQADAAIAQIEQQVTYFTSLFTSMILPSPSQLRSL